MARHYSNVPTAILRTLHAREGYSSEFSVGVCRPVLQIPTLFQTPKYHFPQPFSGLASESCIFICNVIFEKASYHCESQEFNRKFSWNDKFCILVFLYYSFGVEKTNTFLCSRSPLENHTRFKTIMVKVYTHFQTKTVKKPYPLGRHIPI